MGMGTLTSESRLNNLSRVTSHCDPVIRASSLPRTYSLLACDSWFTILGTKKKVLLRIPDFTNFKNACKLHFLYVCIVELYNLIVNIQKSIDFIKY